MADVCCPRYTPCNPSHAPGPPCASPAIYIGLVAAPVALILWFRRNLRRPLVEQLEEGAPDKIPAIPDAPTVSSSTTTPQAEAEGIGSSSGGDDEAGGDQASRDELPAAFTNASIDRSGYVASILGKLSNAFGGIHLDIHSSDESTIHPANGIFIQSMENFCGNTDRVQLIGTRDYSIEPCFVMFDCWVSKLEEDAESICQGEKGRRYIFLLNNTYDVWQMMRCPGTSFSNIELMSRHISMIQRYRKSYFDECWVSLSNPCHLDKFTSDFLMISSCQMTWKVTAELRYELRQEIVDLILPPYEVSLLAVEANRSQLPKMVYCLKRAMVGKKKQKKYTVEAVKKVIRELFEG